jgi:hypothetical protein
MNFVIFANLAAKSFEPKLRNADERKIPDKIFMSATVQNFYPVEVVS